MIGASKYGSPQNALTVWKDYMVEMGFGYTLGVDLPGEARGMIPNSEYYDRHYNRSWNGLTTISNAIGQGEVTLTPLQIANLGATIANRGYYITPHVVRSVDGEQQGSEYTTPHQVSVDKENYEIVVQGMRQSVIDGTCRAANSRDYLVCGKTGTAQNRGVMRMPLLSLAALILRLESWMTSVSDASPLTPAATDLTAYV